MSPHPAGTPTGQQRSRVSPHMPAPRPPARVGFTLMELLVVIGILVTLMGLLFPAINMVRNAAKRGQTTTVIQNVAAACQQYKGARGLYPYGSKTDQSQWRTQVLSMDRESFPKGLVDAWGSDLRYADTRNYDGFFANAAALDGKGVPMPDSFWIWSPGPDQADDPVDWTDPADATSTITMPHGGDDDLANWKP
jgi:type II secretory pathway pseudopilin PulG